MRERTIDEKEREWLFTGLIINTAEELRKSDHSHLLIIGDDTSPFITLTTPHIVRPSDVLSDHPRH